MQENDVQKNIDLIRQKISNACAFSKRDPKSVTVVAASKTVSPEKIREAFNGGIRDFGENYVQDALSKMEVLSDLPIRWHLIGTLQSNKVKPIADRFWLIHSIDRLSTVKQISERSLRRQYLLIEVNLAGETTKSGVPVEALPALLEQAQKLEFVRVCGLMFMPPPQLSESEQRKYFQSARELRDEMMTNVSTPHSLNELSMGTSDDFEAAIKEGATIVRLGTAIFGNRKY